MKKFNWIKVLSLALIVAMAFVPTASATRVFDGTTDKGEVAEINFSEGLSVSKTGIRATVSATNADGDVPIRTNLLAIGRYNGDSLEMQSSTTPIGTAQLAYAVITKRIGGAGGLDETDGGTRLDDGTPGQELTLYVIYVEGSGTWIITPDTTTGFTTITLDAANEFVTLLFHNSTVGWILKGTNATVA